MTDRVKPADAKAVEQAVQWALSEGKTIEIVGAGSKRSIGRPTQTDITLDLSGLTGITLYEPEELVLSARAGTPLKEIAAALESKRQQLAIISWGSMRFPAAGKLSSRAGGWSRTSQVMTCVS
jgi:glycolate oxidase FAD binding subunit